MLRRKSERIQRRRHTNSLEILEPRRVLDSTVVFNEIMYNPAGDGDMEFVELHNQMAVDMDISDWHFSAGIAYTFPKGTVVPGGGYLVVAKDPGTLGNVPGATVLGPFEGRLANGGERLELQDRSDRRMDWLEYDDEDKWPVPPDGSGASLAKRYVDTLSSESSNWTSSILVGGTPGHSNFGDDIQVEGFTIEPKTVSINELAALSDETPFVELHNYGTEIVNLSGLRLASGDYSQDFTETAQLNSGSYLTIQLDAAEKAKLGNQVHLFDDQAGHVLSSVAWAETGLGRMPNGTGPFLKPTHKTPGGANLFDLHDEIVINEIMYNYRPDAPDEGAPTSYSRRIMFPADAVWRYNESGISLPTGWQTEVHPVGGTWKSGRGLLGFERSTLPEPGLNTQLADPRTRSVITHYFETELEMTQQQLDEFDAFELQHAVDDGVIIYVNGIEVTRFQMPDGEATSSTRATRSVSNAKFGKFETVPKDLLQLGSNRISAEVHQRAASSNDIVFGLRMWGLNQVRPARPPRIYQENNEEWLELYNRSERDVSLAGWQLDDAVEYEFEDDAVIPAGGYMVIANDAADLRQKWPEIADQVVGNFTGSLSNRHDRIVLRDDIGNPADVVAYFEDGQWSRNADGRGSSLELRDPDADNSLGLAWAASDETTRSTWNTYVYEGFAEASVIGLDTQWQEFVMGLLSDGEILIDDLSVIQEPYGEATEVLQNGTFEDDTVGDHPATWRIIGNHRHSEIVVDPEDPTNKVLKLVASAATEHMHNHAETTLFKDGDVARIVNGQQYRISYRAKWHTGSSQLNTRLYFSRLPNTTALARPSRHGTPGSQNSKYEDNIGPTYEQFGHAPVVPQPGEAVHVQVAAWDGDGIQSMNAWYSVNNGPWDNVEMVANGTNGLFSAQIPGAEPSDIVQFYVEGTDQLGQSSTFPRGGRDSRAMFQVEDGKATDVGLHNFRMIVRPDDADFMHSLIEVMSNDRIGATFVYNEEEVFYDAKIKLSGSQRARPFQPRMSFQAKFPADQLFRGVHRTITIDRSESTGFGQREHLYHHGMSHAGGGLPSEYNDLFHIITPRAEHTGSAEAQLARYSDIFLDEQYENGSAGQLYEYELTYIPTQTVDRNAQSRKQPNPDTVDGIQIRYQGESNEDYRWGFLNKNNRVQDNYEQFKIFTEVMSIRDDQEFQERIGDVIDVDQWLRSFAFSTITGHGDNYGADGSQHNLQLYVRPSDNRVLFFPHDLDAFFNPNRAITGGNSDLTKLLRVPEWEHMYLGHLLDMIDTTFNRDYMQRWTDHWGGLLPAQNFDGHLESLVKRSEHIIGQVERREEPIAYEITTEDGVVETSFATIDGNAWVNVRELRLQGSSVPLDVEWVETRQWRTQVPLTAGENSIVVEAYNFQGERIGSDTVTITTNIANSVANALEITELNYNPAAPTVDELAVNAQLTNDMFEFIEVTNVSPSPLNLLGVHFSDGIEFAFPAFILGPGESTLVVQNQTAFEQRFGADHSIVGEFTSGRLGNGGERVAVTDLYDTTFLEMTYNDQPPWPTAADGTGPSLTRVSIQRPAGEADNWLAMAPSPGVFAMVGDFSMDGTVNEDDIQLMCQATHENNVLFDLNGDGTTNLDDLTALVQNVLGTSAGDAQLDGIFDSNDLVEVLQAGQYNDGFANNSTWTTGDWNCDGEFDSEDIVAAFISGRYVADAPPAVHRVSPPPSFAVPRIHDRDVVEPPVEEKTLELISQANHRKSPQYLEQLAIDAVFGN